MDPFASGRAKLAQLRDEYSQSDSVNEATTRLRYINTLLSDCLGWSTSEIDAEKFHAGDYADYDLGVPVQMIVEAKRDGYYFALPPGLEGRRAIELPTLCEDSNTRTAIEQVLRYCHARGVPIAAICNGHQLIAYYASRQDGTPPMSGRALCFHSLEDMYEDFKTLWGNLSRDGVAARNLQRNLLGRYSQSTAPPKLSDSVHSYPGFRKRTELETDLKILGGLFIQDLESEQRVSDTFLQECYVRSGALSQYALVSKEILRARYSGFEGVTDVEAAPARTKGGINPVVRADIMAAAMSRRPIILIGDVGVGKSMFLRHLIRVDAADVLSNSLVFYIDFGKEPALETNLEEYVNRRLAHQLLNDFGIDVHERQFVRAVYNGEINRFKKSIYGEYESTDPVEFRRHELKMLADLTNSSSAHLRRSLEHIRASHKRSSVVILDNVDQRPPTFQDRVFLIAQAFAETWPATVFVALRPSTFYESRSSGSLTGYQPRVFTVSATRVDDVVSRRLDFAKQELIKARDAGAVPANLSLSPEDLLSYLKVLSNAFRSDARLLSMLENLSGGNLRLALTFLSSFVGSGYVSIERILDVAARGETYILPEHEFIRSMIYGDFAYYNPKSSEICNMFDIIEDDGREHFLLSHILAHVQRTGESAGADGFVSIGDTYDFLQGLGFSQEQVAPHLKRALSKRLIEAPPGKDVGGPHRITSVGSYMYREMIKNFSYVDGMIIDTPITNVLVRAQLRDVESISQRLDRAMIFCDYLDDQWDKFAAMPSTNSAFDWLPISNALRDRIVQIRERAALNQSRYGRN